MNPDINFKLLATGEPLLLRCTLAAPSDGKSAVVSLDGCNPGQVRVRDLTQLNRYYMASSVGDTVRLTAPMATCPDHPEILSTDCEFVVNDFNRGWVRLQSKTKSCDFWVPAAAVELVQTIHDVEPYRIVHDRNDEYYFFAVEDVRPDEPVEVARFIYGEDYTFHKAEAEQFAKGYCAFLNAQHKKNGDVSD
jgi:hypothetical protein